MALDKTSAEYQEKLELYYKARDAYYGSGEQIMTDYEFDQLETELGLENKSEIGASRTENYTVRHPFIQGSLSKVQVKRTAKQTIDWGKYLNEIRSYINKGNGHLIEVTPKLDGVSFEIVIPKNSETLPDDFMPIVSTRGNGWFGKDVSAWFIFNSEDWKDLPALYKAAPQNSLIVIRGEILINKQLYADQYQHEFVNTRSCVAGIIGTDWEDTLENRAKRQALSWMCYDYRIVTVVNGVYQYTELSWDAQKVEYGNKEYMRLGNRPILYRYDLDKITPEDFHQIYDEMDEMRSVFNLPGSEYALDGFVIKPDVSHRISNLDIERPKECVAVKFCPAFADTVIRDIVWEQGKTGEIYPVGVCDTVILDSKKVNRVSLHNYNQVVKSGTGIGAEIRVSLAGDIIPFVYKVLSPVTVGSLNEQKKTIKLPEYKEIKVSEEGQMHLMGELSKKDQFCNSADALNIFGIGPAIAEELFTLTGSQYTNILEILNEESYLEIAGARGADQVSTINIIQYLKDFAGKVTLEEVILSMCFESCGRRCSKKCADYIRKGSANFTHMPEKAYSWVKDQLSPKYIRVMEIASNLGLLDDSKGSLADSNDTEVKIPVILTGDTKRTIYATKKEWLAAHPQYVETTSWSECKILFTNDLDSNSSKMAKARKKNIEIREYED